MAATGRIQELAQSQKEKTPVKKNHSNRPSISHATLFLLALFVALLAASFALASDPPWKAKPYDQWDDKDLERIFGDSPWTRKVEVTRTWSTFSAKDNQQNDQLRHAARPMPGDTARSEENSIGGDVDFFVDWASARPMRAASARKSVLHGGKSDLDVQKYANEPQEEFQIILQSQDMNFFQAHDEKSVASNAFLEIKKPKQKILPSHVQYERDDKGAITSAIFFFPKKAASGEATLTGSEKSVDFSCKIGETALRVTFEPIKMVDKDGPAL
jgi:hypothetical protein